MIKFKILEHTDDFKLLGFVKAQASKIISLLRNGEQSFYKKFIFGDTTVRMHAQLVASDWIVKLWFGGGFSEYPYVPGFGLFPHTPRYNLSGYIAGDVVTFGWKGNAISFKRGAVDPYTHRLDGIEHLVNAKKLRFAEYFIRGIRFTPFIFGIELSSQSDYALLCEEGFFVDPSMYVGQPFENRLNSIAASYLSSFNHSTLPSAPVFVNDDEHSRIHHGPGDRNEVYGDAHYVFDPTKRMLWNTAQSGAGTALITANCVSPPQFPMTPPSTGTDMLAADTQTMVEMQERTVGVLASVNAYDELSTVERVQFKIEHLSRAYHKVVFAPNILHIPIRATGSSFYGPMDGVSSIVYERARYRRGPSGWAQTLNEVLPTNVSMSFVCDGNTPPNYSTPVSGSTTIDVRFRSLGTDVVISTRQFLSSAFSYTSAPVAFNSVFPHRPSFNYAGEPAVDAAGKAGCVNQRFEDDRSLFDLMGDGDIRITTKDGGSVVTIVPITPTPITSFPTVNSIATWSSPFGGVNQGLATQQDQLDETVVNGSMAHCRERGSTARITSPPASQFFGCVYFALSGNYLYARLIDATTDGLAQFVSLVRTFLVGIAGNQSGNPSLDNAGTIEERRAAMLSKVVIEAKSDGLSDDAIAFMTFSGTTIFI